MQVFLTLILPFVIMFGIMYLLLIRPQNKKEQRRHEVVNSLQTGDQIRTFGGVIGTIKAINDNSFIVHSGNADVELLKEAIADKIEK